MFAALPMLAMLAVRDASPAPPDCDPAAVRSCRESLYQKEKAIEWISGSGCAATSSSASTGAATSGAAARISGRYASPTFFSNFEFWV